MNAVPRLVVGVDGGGSKTVAWLAETRVGNACEVLGRGRGGSTNGRSVGMETAAQNLSSAIEAAFDDAELRPCRVAAACLAMAGADRDVEKEFFQSWADRTEVADRVVITNDALPVIYAAHEDAVGIALISGTGSLAIGRQADGTVGRCGGWGGLFGDEGSGYAIAIAALRAAARAEDGRGPETRLRDALVERLGVSKLMDAVPHLYNPSTSRGEIASLAPLVFKVASCGDEVAALIIRHAAETLAELVMALTRRMSFDATSLPLALAGSVLLNQETLVDQVLTRLKEASIDCHPIKLVHDPVEGAVAIARESLI